VGGELSEYVIILVEVKDTMDVDERDPSVADAVVVFTMDRVIVEEVDLETLALVEYDTLGLGLNEVNGLTEEV